MRLVLADRPAEHDALLGIARGPRQRRAADADGLGRDQYALGIHAVQDVLEAPALLADAVLERHRQAVEEQLVGVDRLAAHLVDDARLHVLAVERGVEQREPLGALLHLLERRGAGEQQHAVGHLRGGDPDLLPVDRIAVAVRARPGS